MDLNITSGGPLVIRAPGTVWDGQALAPLTMADLGELQAHIPTPASGGTSGGGGVQFVTIFELHRFAQTVEGADWTLWLSLRKREPQISIEQVRRMGSILQRVEIARALMGQSLTTGEDELLAEEPAKKKPAATTTSDATGHTRPR